MTELALRETEMTRTDREVWSAIDDESDLTLLREMIQTKSYSGSGDLVAYVKAVGQVEAIAAVFLSLVIWKEREIVPQIPGMTLVVFGIWGTTSRASFSRRPTKCSSR